MDICVGIQLNKRIMWNRRRLGNVLELRTCTAGSNWVVAESELEARRPTPVCLLDGTKVLFRFSEDIAQQLQLGIEAEATFRMLKNSKDVFEFMNGKRVGLDHMPRGVVFDVLVVPGSEQDSALLSGEPVVESEESAEAEEKGFLGRLLLRL